VWRIFTRVWRIMDLIRSAWPWPITRPCRRVVPPRGETQLAVFRRIVEMDQIGAMWYGDDLAYATGTMVRPDVLRRHLFPYLKGWRCCAATDLPLSSLGWQTCGHLARPDRMRFNALHPLSRKR